MKVTGEKKKKKIPIVFSQTWVWTTTTVADCSGISMIGTDEILISGEIKLGTEGDV